MPTAAAWRSRCGGALTARFRTPLRAPPVPPPAPPQADLDLGNYERFVDITLTRDHNITTGKIYQARAARALCSFGRLSRLPSLLRARRARVRPRRWR